jgi:hypothetical protein
VLASAEAETTKINVTLTVATLDRLREHIAAENRRTFPAKTSQSAVIEVAINAYLAAREPRHGGRTGDYRVR